MYKQTNVNDIVKLFPQYLLSEYKPPLQKNEMFVRQFFNLFRYFVQF